MSDITYENLIAARQAKKEGTGEFDIMSAAKLALGILEQVNKIKGGEGNRVQRSRSQEDASGAVTQPQSNLNSDTILEALKTVKSLKGDIKLSELEKLINEHHDQISMLLGKV